MQVLFQNRTGLSLYVCFPAISLYRILFGHVLSTFLNLIYCFPDFRFFHVYISLLLCLRPLSPALCISLYLFIGFCLHLLVSCLDVCLSILLLIYLSYLSFSLPPSLSLSPSLPLSQRVDVILMDYFDLRCVSPGVDPP